MMCVIFQTINSMAHMKRTKYGKVDLDYVLGIGGFDLERCDFSSFTSSYYDSSRQFLPKWIVALCICYGLIVVEVLGDGFVTLVYCWWWLIGLSFQN